MISSPTTNPTSSLSTHRISSLPLAPLNQRLQSLLVPTPSKSASFLSTLQTTPSTQRRSTTFPSGHFTHVSPLPIGFPYRLPSKLDDESGERVASVSVEEWLTSQEPLELVSMSGPGEEDDKAKLRLYGSKEGRTFPTVLLALSPNCLHQVLPHLDVGDALDVVQQPLPSNLTRGEESQDGARDELVGVLGGREVLMKLDLEGGGGGEGGEYKPWSLRYGGRQFGSWASQLGDGRAISLIETVTPSGEIQEIQIKGAGRTPFSRHADGLAVLRSSIREFLGAENAAAFPSNSLPTSRSLSLTLLPTLQVMREYGPEPGAIASRIAPSFLRIGSFEILNPPENEFLFSFAMMTGGKMPEKVIEWENLRILADLVKAKLFGFGREGEGGQAEGAWEMVREISRRNAKMVAGWQAWGFMHGVINTDNVSVLGLTIDYGPYAYMDAFARNHVCNHSDETGRYSYAAQPEMVYFAINALLQATAELIGYESSHSASSPAPAGWATDGPSSDLKSWRSTALAKESELRKEFFDVYHLEYRTLMGRRLGLPGTTTERDESELVETFLDLLERHSLDFHSSFRSLCFFDPSSSSPSDPTSSIDRTTQQLLSTAKACSPTAAKEIGSWLEKYDARIGAAATSGEEGVDEHARKKEMKNWNPRFVLRQWVLEEIIKKVERGEPDSRIELNRILKMATNPFLPYGREEDAVSAAELSILDDSHLSPEEKEERRLCGLGPDEMLGFQCSCSS